MSNWGLLARVREERRDGEERGSHGVTWISRE